GGKELMFFSAFTKDLGTELWVSDGTAAGTFPIDINPGPASSDPASITVVGQEVLFSATTAAHGRELWFSTGTAAATSEIKDLNPGPADGLSQVAEIAVIPFTTTAVFAGNDGVHGTELWSTSGSPFTMLADIATGSGSSNPQNFLAMPGLGKVFFSAADNT